MPVVPAKCPECGGAITVDSSKKAGVCQFCDNAFIIEEAINNYNITQNIKADNVNVYSGMVSFEELLKREPIYQRTNDTSALHDLYMQMRKHYPQRYEGWWGSIKLGSNNFTDFYNFDVYENYWQQVKQSAPQNVLAEISVTYSDYQRRAEKSRLTAQLKIVNENIAAAISDLESANNANPHPNHYIIKTTKGYLKSSKSRRNSQIIGALVPLLIAVIIFVVLGGEMHPIILLAALAYAVYGIFKAFSNNKDVGRYKKDLERYRQDEINSAVSNEERKKNLKIRLSELKKQAADLEERIKALR